MIKVKDVFARQLIALSRPQHVLVVFSTTANSQTVTEALKVSREAGLTSVVFQGRDGDPAKAIADCSLIVRH